MSQEGGSPLGVVWAKWTPDAPGGPYPLLAHLLDTGAWATAMWRAWAPASLRSVVEGATYADGERLVALLAGTHDCGKADPWFQGQLGSPRAADFAANLTVLWSRGLPCPEPAEVGALRRRVEDHPDARRLVRHECMSGHALVRQGWPDWTAAVLAGHHGRYPPDAVPRHRRAAVIHRAWVDQSPWQIEQDALSVEVVRAFGARRAFAEKVPGHLIPVLTGLVILADWLASDEAFLETSPLDLLDSDPAAYAAHRIGEAQGRLPTTLGVGSRPVGSFPDLFAGKSPDRELQAWAVSVDDHQPALTVIAAPMGEGKTEAALWTHAASSNGDGLVFALPTMATADAMFDRVLDFFAGTPTMGALRHSTALLNAFYADADAQPTGVCDGDSIGGVGAASQWLNGRHRSLTAPVTVSTCDQVLAAAVTHRFLPVRLASLATKHLILDEVHTYDPYQDALLKRLLGWLGRYGTRVTLLSATLPTRRVASYLEAYAGEPLPDVQVSYPSVVRADPGGHLEEVALTAHRRYVHEVQVVPMPAAPLGPRSAEAAVWTAKYVDEIRRANPDARIGLIVNTVDRAIDIARNLAGSPAPLVLHSRMTAAQRHERTATLLRMAGPDAGDEPVTVVATQVAEASLDLDFDILISDLAPMASLLQRMGRQWRHSQPHSAGWRHSPATAGRRIGDPVVHVLVPLSPNGQLDARSCMPYTVAEMQVTLSRGLQEGNRTSIRIPDDLQALIDACEISLDDLDDGEQSVQALIDHLGAAAAEEGTARAAGVDVADLDEAWEFTPVWDANPVLESLTEGRLWHGNAVTRLRDSFSLDILPIDTAGDVAFACRMSPDEMLARSHSRSELREILGSVIPVSGSAASAIDRGTPHPPDGWEHQPSALLSGLHPVTIEDLAGVGFLLDPEMGLVRA